MTAIDSNKIVFDKEWIYGKSQFGLALCQARQRWL